MRAIIYCRKSTDWDEMQQNSLDHQVNNCIQTLEKNNLTLFCDPIIESASAKEEFTRKWFNEVIEKCKQWWVDFIIVDEPKRISRNNIDTSRIIDLMDKKQIQWIYATTRTYTAENPRDKFLLQLDLSLSKMDNEDRSIDVKNKMLSLLRNWRFLWKAPFGYKNIGKKWSKDIAIDEERIWALKMIFTLKIGTISREWFHKLCIWNSTRKFQSSWSKRNRFWPEKRCLGMGSFGCRQGRYSKMAWNRNCLSRPIYCFGFDSWRNKTSRHLDSWRCITYS